MISSLNDLNSAIVISGSLSDRFERCRFPFDESEQTRSLANRPSLRHLKVSFGVVVDARGSSCALSIAEVDGSLKDWIGMSNSQYEGEFHLPSW